MLELITKRPTAIFATMTKELVDALLALNTRNRNQRSTIISHYKLAIERGLWVPTNQGIGVAASGFLVDGQHRLLALRESGYPPVMMLVVTGLPDEAMASVDGGTNRTPQDHLQFLFDEKVSRTVVAILRTSLSASGEFNDYRRYLPQEYADRLELLGGSITAVLSLEGSRHLPAASLAALVDAHCNWYPDKVMSFTHAVVTGAMLEKSSPALLLRDWLARTKGGGGTAMMRDRYAKTIAALRAWIEERPLTKLYRRKAQTIAGPGGGA